MELLTRRAPLRCSRSPHIQHRRYATPRQRPAATGPYQRNVHPPPTRSQLSRAGRTLLGDFRRGEKNPATVLKDRLHENRLDLETVRICVTSYKMLHLSRLDKPQRIARARSDVVGATALDFLWKDGQRWKRLLQDDILLFSTLCFCLAAEGHAKYIFDLLRLENPLGGPNPSVLRPGWRGIVLRAYIRAELETTLGTNADAVLDRFFEIRGM